MLSYSNQLPDESFCHNVSSALEPPVLTTVISWLELAAALV
ncbi:MAG: hypothetical protein PUJ05_12250 [Clostridium sp.]|nr:hypothetical protein [Clostridium sp.]MDD7683690.1 hypothetical protein [Clostridium sp.]MDY2580554.1 hypothetical protein [Clostridium sp.]